MAAPDEITWTPAEVEELQRQLLVMAYDAREYGKLPSPAIVSAVLEFCALNVDEMGATLVQAAGLTAVRARGVQ
jgi:hypothetical protein